MTKELKARIYAFLSPKQIQMLDAYSQGKESWAKIAVRLDTPASRCKSIYNTACHRVRKLEYLARTRPATFEGMEKDFLNGVEPPHFSAKDW